MRGEMHPQKPQTFPRRPSTLGNAAPGTSWAARQGLGKVVFQQVSRHVMAWSGWPAWCRSPAAMLVQPVRRRKLIAVFRMVAMTWGALPVRIWERSSSKVTSRHQWIRFSMPQCPWTHPASVAGGAPWWSAEVMR